MAKQKNGLNSKLPRTIFLCMLSLSAGLMLFGLINDMTGGTCTGIMGASVSCMDRIILFPVATLFVPLLVLSGAWWLIVNMSRDTEISPKKNKKTKN